MYDIQERLICHCQIYSQNPSNPGG